MKKVVYLVEENRLYADSFDTGWTFDLKEALDTLASEARWGYEKERKDAEKVQYWLMGYEIDIDEMSEEMSEEDLEGVNVDDAKELYNAWLDTLCGMPDPVYAKKWALEAAEAEHEAD